MEEDLLQTLKEVEAMAAGEVNLDDIASLDDDDDDGDEEMPSELGEDEDTDSEFLNEYESTFNFIDSELDALRSSIDDIKPSSSSEEESKNKKDVDDSSYSSSSDRSPFQMPVIDETLMNLGFESEPEEVSEVEEELEARMIEASEEYRMEQEEIEMTSKPSAEKMETTEENEPQVDASAQIESVQSAVEQLEQNTVKQPLEESFAQVEIRPKEETQVKPDTLPQAPPTQLLDQVKKPSQTFHFLTTLFSIALAFLTGQRFPTKQDHCHSPSLEMAAMKPLLQPHEFQTIDLHLNNNNNFDYDFEQVLFDSGDDDYCEREEDVVVPLFDMDTIELEMSEPQVYQEQQTQQQQQQQTEAIERLSVGDKAAHAVAIHEALEEHEVLESEDFDFGAIEFYFEDTLDMEVVSYQPMGVLEETYFEFGEISAADWFTPKLLEMMQNQNMETVYVVYEEPVVDQSINLHFGLTEYEGLFISMEMMQFIEPHCAVPLLL